MSQSHVNVTFWQLYDDSFEPILDKALWGKWLNYIATLDAAKRSIPHTSGRRIAAVEMQGAKEDDPLLLISSDRVVNPTTNNHTTGTVTRARNRRGRTFGECVYGYQPCAGVVAVVSVGQGAPRASTIAGTIAQLCELKPKSDDIAPISLAPIPGRPLLEKLRDDASIAMRVTFRSLVAGLNPVVDDQASTRSVIGAQNPDTRALRQMKFEQTLSLDTGARKPHTMTPEVKRSGGQLARLATSLAGNPKVDKASVSFFDEDGQRHVFDLLNENLAVKSPIGTRSDMSHSDVYNAIKHAYASNRNYIDEVVARTGDDDED